MNELSKKKSHKVTITDTAGYDSIGEDSFRLADDCRLREARMNLLKEKVSQLGESCRQLLQLSWCGNSMEEVATILNVTYGYARKKKSECMGKLVELVKQSSEFNSLKW